MIQNNSNEQLTDLIKKRLCRKIPSNSEQVVAFCKMNSELLLKFKRRILFAENQIVLLRALKNLNNINSLLRSYKKALQYCKENLLYKQGDVITKIINKSCKEGLFKYDDIPYILKSLVDFKIYFSKYGNTINLMCNCAFLFSSMGAFQQAYRLLNDAQEISTKNKLIQKQAKILFVQGSICIEEGDYKSATSDLEKAMNLIYVLEKSLRFPLISNLATVKMKCGNYEGAKELYNNLLSGNFGEVNEKIKNIIHLNLSICQRELGEVVKAEKNIESVINIILQQKDFSVDELIEAYLVAARTYTTNNKFIKAVESLSCVINLIDIMLSEISRLYQRRGIREKYILRIRDLLIHTVAGQKVEDLLDIIVFTYQNSFSDWLSVLDWYTKVSDDDLISEEVKNDIKINLNRVINFGAPVLYGFREKYDDPFEESLIPNYTNPWLEFNLSMENIISTTEYKSPYFQSTIEHNRKIVLNLMKDQTSFIFIYLQNGFINFIYHIDKYTRNQKIKYESYLEFLSTLTKYQIKETNFQTFNTQLNLLVTELYEDLLYLIDEIIGESPRELIIVPDKSSYHLPIVAVLLKHEALRSLLRGGNLQLKYNSIIYESKKMSVKGRNYTGIVLPSDDLPLINEEIQIPIRMMNPDYSEILDLTNNKINYEKDLLNADIIHIASHGTPISVFTDPVFASIIGGYSENSIGLDEIQSNFWRLNHSIVITNACDSADISSRNFQKHFSTNEIISSANLFMLNRRSCAVSVTWPMKDIMSYIFALIFYEKLAEGVTYQVAYGSSLAHIYDLTKDDLIGLLSRIDDDSLREAKIDLFKGSHSLYPLRNPYCYGAYIFSDLL